MRSRRWAVLCSLPVAVGAALGCNGLLGIGPASREADEAGAAQSLTCQYYCQTIVQNCAQANAEFLGGEDPTALCMSMCPALDVGTAIAATNDDTLGCRIFYAEQAATDPVTNCRFAGMLGGGKCGSDGCQVFCSLDVNYCTSALLGGQIPTPYTSQGDCLATCGDGGYPYLTQDAGDLLEGTNTLNCRFWHLENANGSTAAGQFHCPHTQRVSMTCN